MRRFLLLILLINLSVILRGAAQAPPDSVRLFRIGYQLEELAQRDKTYNEEIDLSVGRMPLMDMLRNVAKASKVNLSVAGAENVMVTCNFSRAKIKDLLFFLCKEYDLDIEIIGNIISISPASAFTPEPNVIYDGNTDEMSYDLSGESLIEVAKKITRVSGVNLVVPQPLYSREVSGFVERMPFDDALSTLASVNGMDAVKNKNGTWEIIYSAGQPGGEYMPAPQYSRRSYIAANELEVDSLGYITAQIGRGNVRDIIIDLCEQLGYNYFFVSDFDHHTSVFIREVGFETLLSVLLAGSPYTYYRENGIYIFGSSQSPGSGIVSARVIPLHYRSVNTLDEIIPESLTAGLQIKQFSDLNSIIACGDQRDVARVETFLHSIDKRVPLVTIEVMIVDVNKSNLRETGISAGLGENVKTSGRISPGIDMTLSSSSVNKLLNSFSGFGSVKLGKVSSDFYMSLKFLEDNEIIEVRSTPKLSTLNGHEATLTSGEKRYYKENTNTWMGTQNPVQIDSYVWKDVDANMTITITPFVSEDRHITLDIEIEQTEFKTASNKSEDAPPPETLTRSFKSLIRVENEEMVLLGGIDRNEMEKGSSGVPFISRVPVLKWIFGNSKNNKIDSSLSIFIKPTILD